MTQQQPILSARKLSKRYGATQALDQVDIDLYLASVVALIGENGAGKSTLVKVISGAVAPDSGQIEYEAEVTELRTVQAAQELGIRVIHQVPALAMDLSILDNVFLGSELTRSMKLAGIAPLQRRRQYQRLEPLLDRFASELHPDMRLASLKAHEQRLVGIIKALANEARVLILDEPTAALPAHERVRLLDTVRQLRDQGVAVLYVSHHLEEIEQLADEVVVLRDGKLVGHEQGASTVERMVELMLGQSKPKRSAPKAKAAERQNGGENKQHFRLEVTPPTSGRQVTAVEETVRIDVPVGEIVILTGLVGSGVSEVGEAAYGARMGWTTTIAIGDRVHPITRPTDAVDLGIGYLSDDRIGNSVFPDLSIKSNVTLVAIKNLVNGWRRIDKKREDAEVAALNDSLAVRRSSDDQGIMELSGGNQQKVMIGRWLYSGSRFLILSEPTQGIDVIAKAEVLQLLREYVNNVGAVLIVSTEPSEYLAAADRAWIMRRGKVTAELTGGQLTLENVTEAALVHHDNGDSANETA